MLDKEDLHAGLDVVLHVGKRSVRLTIRGDPRYATARPQVDSSLVIEVEDETGEREAQSLVDFGLVPNASGMWHADAYLTRA